MKRDFNAISKLLNRYLDLTANSEYLYNKKYKIGDTNHLIKKDNLIFMIKNNNHKYGIFFNWKKNEPEKKNYTIRLIILINFLFILYYKRGFL